MSRTHPPSPLPADEDFTPGRDPGGDAHPPEDEFWQNVMYESNQYKIDHYRAAAQHMANEWDCAVLLHFYKLPGFQRTQPTMMAAFIPADEGWWPRQRQCRRHSRPRGNQWPIVDAEAKIARAIMQQRPGGRAERGTRSSARSGRAICRRESEPTPTTSRPSTRKPSNATRWPGRRTAATRTTPTTICAF